MSHRNPNDPDNSDYSSDSQVDEEVSEFSGSGDSQATSVSELSDDLNVPTLSEPIQIDQNLLSHPIFHFSDDFFLNSFGQILRPLLVASPYTENLQGKLDQFNTYLFQSIFGNQPIEALKEGFKKLGLAEKTTCGKVLSSKTGVAFRCLDCEPPDNGSGLTSILCAQCFDKSNHDGHRIVVEKLTKANTAFCDCGEEENLKPEGFCPDHKRNQADRDQELKKMPKELLKKCQGVLSKAFYAGICVFELVERLPLGACRNAFMSFGQKFIDQVLEFIQNGYKEISNSFILVLSSLLEGKFEAPFNKVWHNCDSLDVEEVRGIIGEKRECKCTLTSALLRYSPWIEMEVQSRLKKVLIECMQDAKYKDFMCEELVKNLKFIFPMNYLNKEDSGYTKNSYLITLNFVLAATENTALKVIESPYFMHYMDVIKKTIENFDKPGARLSQAAYFFDDIMIWFVNPSYKVLMEKMLEDGRFIQGIFDCLAEFEKKFAYKEFIEVHAENIKWSYINKGLDIQARLIRGIIHCLKYIVQKDEAQQKILLGNLVKSWYKAYDGLGYFEGQNLNLSLERVFCLILKSYKSEVSKESLENFFREFLPEVNVKEFTEKILRNVTRGFGVFRLLTLLKDPGWSHLGKGYYYFMLLNFEMDVSLIQMLLLLIGSGGIYEMLTESFIGFCQIPHDTVFKDFLQLLVYLMTDELCILNLNFKLFPQEQTNSDPHTERIVEKATINLLLGSYWTDVFYIKDNLTNKILLDSSKVNKIIQKVTVLNEKDRKIRLKDEYEAELDPYIFRKSPLLQGEIANDYTSRAQKNVKLDVVGGKSYENLQKHLYEIQERLFLSQGLPRLLAKMIIEANKGTYQLVPTVLKLVLMNLEFAVKNKRIEESYMTNEFNEKLKELLKTGDLQECKICIERIQELLQAEAKGEKVEEEKEGDSEAEKKKKAAQDKMNKMKEEFAKKQALFADKNKETMTETGTEEVVTGKEEEEMVCQHCLNKVGEDSNETYGIPIYISFTNNLASEKTAPFPMTKNQSAVYGLWWPVISSCHHYYHEKCFKTMCQNLEKTDDPSLITQDKVLYCCSLCKNLCDTFLVMSGESKESENIAHVVGKKLSNFLDWAGCEYDPLQITERFLFERTHQYFVNTFHLLKSQPETLEKAIKFHVSLMREFDPSGKENKGQDFSDKTFMLKYILNTVLPILPKKSDTLRGFIQYKSENLLLFLYHTLYDSLLGEKNDKKSLQITLQILKQYLQIRLLQKTAASYNSESPLTLPKCLAMLQGYPSLYDKISKELLLPIQRTALAFAIDQLATASASVDVRKLCELLCISGDIDQLFKTVNIPMTFEELVKECLTELAENLDNPELMKVDQLLQASNEVSEENKKIHIANLSPRFIELPETFLRFNNKYQVHRCDLCNKYNKSKESAVCLICDKVICIGECAGQDGGELGNLTRHAIDYHFGSALFMHIFQNIWILNEGAFSIAAIPKDVYIDALGQPIFEQLELEGPNELEKLNFKEYCLNQNLVEDLERIVNGHEYIKEMRRAVLNLEDPDEQVETMSVYGQY